MDELATSFFRRAGTRRSLLLVPVPIHQSAARVKIRLSLSRSRPQEEPEEGQYANEYEVNVDHIPAGFTNGHGVDAEETHNHENFKEGGQYCLRETIVMEPETFSCVILPALLREVDREWYGGRCDGGDCDAQQVNVKIANNFHPHIRLANTSHFLGGLGTPCSSPHEMGVVEDIVSMKGRLARAQHFETYQFGY
ncbi:hypothetical protein BC830DRAFT_1079886 [Chytriomyces sp. MP71]|nr:hypothetical protein BC830DRAFT_1079886 [Chytriomyces sp. MP71]